MPLTTAELLAELEIQKANDEVKNYLKGKAGEFGINPELNLETVRSHINSKKEDDEYKKFLNSIADERVTRAIQTYESGTLKNKLDEQKKALTEEFEKRGKETPEAKANREMRERMATYEIERKKDKVSIYATTYASEKGVPLKLVMKVLNNIDFSNDDIEKIKESAKSEIDDVVSLFGDVVKNKVAEELKKNSYIPPKGSDSSSTEWTDAKIKELEDKAKSTGKDVDIARYSKARREFEIQKAKKGKQ